MWRLLPVLLLFSCAFNEQQSENEENQSDRGRIVQRVELPVETSAQTVDGLPSTKSFHKTGMRGWLDDIGVWHINAEVHHDRLRCATYATGIQLGRGNPACSAVEWLTGVKYVTRLRHCNNATRVHSGGRGFSEVSDRPETVTCVRIVVRCEGTC